MAGAHACVRCPRRGAAWAAEGAEGCSCDLPEGSGALARPPGTLRAPERGRAPGGPGSRDFTLPGGSWGLIKAWKPPEPSPLCWPFGGHPGLFSFPWIYDPFVLKPRPQAPSPLPILLPRADTRIFLFPLEKSWEVCLWLRQKRHTHLCRAAGTAGNAGTGVSWSSEHTGASPSVRDCHTARGGFFLCCSRRARPHTRTSTPGANISVDVQRQARDAQAHGCASTLGEHSQAGLLGIEGPTYTHRAGTLGPDTRV